MHHSIEIDRLSYAYPDGHRALQDVSLHIQPCEKVALVGPNGAGKSTLILHLNGILQGQGQVHVCGLEVKEPNLGKIRAMVGLVFQSPEDQLFSPTVFDDVAFGPLYQGLSPEEVQRRVDEALSAVHMSAYSDRVSHHLSLGEKKRIAIATVLSMNPDLLVLDEPSSNLDPRARNEFSALLQGMRITKILVTHDLPFVFENCDRVVVMSGGRIVADGDSFSILSDEALLSEHGLELPYGFYPAQRGAAPRPHEREVED